MISLQTLPVKAAGDEKYLLLGDSIAVGTGTLNPQLYRYGRLVADDMGFEEINLAVNGYTTTDLLSLVNNSDNSQYITSADYIQISICGNNFLHSSPASLIASALRGDYSQANAITESALSELETIVAKIRVLNSDAVLLLQTLYNPYSSVNKKAVSKALEGLNSGIEKIAEEDGNAYIVDVFSAFEGHSDYIADDTIHPNENGHKVIAEITEETLNGIGNGKKSDSSFSFDPAMLVIAFAAVVIVILIIKKITGKP